MIVFMSEDAMLNLIYTTRQMNPEKGIRYTTKFVDRFESIKSAAQEDEFKLY